MISDPVLEALWKNVLDRWDEDAAHGAFLEHCRLEQRLDEAATRYRGMAGDRTRAAIAEKRLKAVTLLALAQLETARSSPRVAAGRSVVMLLIAALLATAIGVLIWGMRSF
jgi:hypothetical protein